MVFKSYFSCKEYANKIKWPTRKCLYAHVARHVCGAKNDCRTSRCTCPCWSRSILQVLRPDETVVVVTRGANKDTSTFRRVSLVANADGQGEAMLAISLPEKPDSFERFCERFCDRVSYLKHCSSFCFILSSVWFVNATTWLCLCR